MPGQARSTPSFRSTAASAFFTVSGLRRKSTSQRSVAAPNPRGAASITARSSASVTTTTFSSKPKRAVSSASIRAASSARFWRGARKKALPLLM